jgi:hypothetical protein
MRLPRNGLLKAFDVWLALLLGVGISLLVPVIQWSAEGIIRRLPEGWVISGGSGDLHGPDDMVVMIITEHAIGIAVTHFLPVGPSGEFPAWGRAGMLTVHDLPAWARPYYVSDTWRWCVAYGWPSHSLISCGPGTWGSRFPGPGLTPFPNDLRWRGAAVNAACFSFVVFTVIIGCRFLGRLTLTRMRLRRKQCTVCGYDIGAIRAQRCPECGTRRST